MRKSIDGLMAIIRDTYEMDPYSNSLFLFCGRRCDRIKALHFEKDGFCLLYKRLDNGRFQWPRNSSEVRNLTRQEYRWLLEGLSIDQPKAIRLPGRRIFDFCAKGRKFPSLLRSPQNAAGNLSTGARNRYRLLGITGFLSPGMVGFWLENGSFSRNRRFGYRRLSTYRIRQNDGCRAPGNSLFRRISGIKEASKRKAVSHVTVRNGRAYKAPERDH